MESPLCILCNQQFYSDECTLGQNFSSLGLWSDTRSVTSALSSFIQDSKCPCLLQHDGKNPFRVSHDMRRIGKHCFRKVLTGRHQETYEHHIHYSQIKRVSLTSITSVADSILDTQIWVSKYHFLIKGSTAEVQKIHCASEIFLMAENKEVLGNGCGQTQRQRRHRN